MNILGELKYATTKSGYVAPPLAELNAVLEHKEEMFNQNITAANQLEIAASNISVLDIDNPIKQNALNKVKDTFAQTYEANNWENATSTIRRVAKDFATDPLLKTAIQSKAKRDSHISVLTEMVNKGKLLESDVAYAVSQSDEVYTGAKLDPNTGLVSGSWNPFTPPEYIDRGAYIDKFLTDFKPDQRFGQFVKKNDGWYKVREVAATPGGHELGLIEERADYAELYSAARTHMLQNKQISERVDYETSKDKRTVQDFISADPKARDAMINDLADIMGYNRKDLHSLPDDRLVNLYKKEAVIHESVQGAVAKHSYVKEDIRPLGLTYDAQMALAKAKSKDTSEDKVNLTRTVLQNKGIAFVNPFHYPDNVADKETVNIETDRVISSLQDDIFYIKRDLDNKVQQLKTQGLSDVQIDQNPEIESLRRSLDETTFRRNEQIFVKDQNDRRYRKVVDSLIESGVITREEASTVESVNNELRKQISDDELNFVNNELVSTIENKIKQLPVGNARSLLQKSLEAIQNKEHFPVDMFGAGASADTYKTLEQLIGGDNVERYRKVAEQYNSIVEKSQDTINKIDKALAQTNKENLIETSYAEIGLGYGDVRSDWSKESRFAVTVKNSFLANPEGWTIFDESGKRYYEDKPAGKRNVDVKDVNIIGMTTEPVGTYGYLVAARITVPDGEKEKQEFVYLKPSTGYGSNIVEAAKQEIMEGNVQLLGKDKPGAAQTAVDLARKWDKYLLDEHLSRFNDEPIKPNDARTINVPLAYNGMIASVQRIVPNYEGNMFYEVIIQNADGSTNVEAMGGNLKLEYKDRHKLEGDLEHFQGVMFEQRFGGKRTDVHNNPTALITDLAKEAGLKEGIDYTVGKPFTTSSGNQLFTANLLGDSIAQTIKIIDAVGFTTSSGKPRWSYIDPSTNEQWKNMTTEQKAAFIAEMKKFEDGQNSIFHKK